MKAVTEICRAEDFMQIGIHKDVTELEALCGESIHRNCGAEGFIL